MEAAYLLMRDETNTRIDLRVRSETLLELHTGLVQLWLYCIARETGAPESASTLAIDIREVTQGTLTRIAAMFRRAGVAFFLNTDAPKECALSVFRTVLAHYTLSFSILPHTKTMCSGRAPVSL